MGLGLSVLKLLHTFTRLRIKLLSEADHRTCRLHLEGSATFLRLPELAAALEKVPAQAVVHVDCQELSYIDHACLDLLHRWETEHCAAGGCLILDWESLAARNHFRRTLKERNPAATVGAPSSAAGPNGQLPANSAGPEAAASETSRAD